MCKKTLIDTAFEKSASLPLFHGSFGKARHPWLARFVPGCLLACSTAFFSAEPLQGENAPDDPAVYWSFNEDYSATEGGSDYDGEPAAGAAIDPWQSRFDTASLGISREQSQYVDIPNSPIPTGEDFSFAAWYYLDLPTITSGRYAVIETRPRWSISFELAEDDVARVWSDGDAEATPHDNFEFAAGEHQQWRHIATTYTQADRQFEVFLDGNSVGTFELSEDNDTVSTSEGLVLGAHRGFARNWDGWIDDVAVWHRVLSEEEIAYLQDNPVLPIPADYEPPIADFEPLDAPFVLDFGTGGEQDDGERLLMTPSGHPFSLESDSLNFTPGHASAMASVDNYLERQDFTLEAEIRPEQYVQPNENDRVGFAVLGGPHDPPDSEFDTTAGDFHALTWSPAVDSTTSVIEIREGFDGAVLADAVWEGRHPSEGSGEQGIGEVYAIEADGVYDETGALELTLTLTDRDGFSQSVSAWIVEPADGNLFGFGGLLESEATGDPEFDFLNLSMEVGDEPGPIVEDPATERPFRFAFGSDSGRDSDESFALNVEEDWSLEGQSLRLETSEENYHSSLASTRVVNHSPDEEFLIEMSVTLTDLEANDPSDNRVALVLFGDEDRDVFDPEDDNTYYTFQWTPNPSDGARIAVRQGMNGEVIAETGFEDLENPPLAPSSTDPSAGIGEQYRFVFRGEFEEGGDLDFRAILTDGSGGYAEVSETLPAPGGNRFGFGGQQRAAEGPVWDFHEFNWFEETWIVDYEPLDAPFTLDFGTGGDQVGLDPLLVPERLQDWSIEDDSLRYASLAGHEDDPDSGWTDSAAVVEVANYQSRQDFTLETEVTMEEMARDWNDAWQRFGFGVLGGPHSLEAPFSQNSVGYKLLMMRGEIRLIDHGVGILAREDWEGVHENGAVYRMEAEGEFDELGRLVLSLTVTDNTGHSQTVTTDTIDQPHEGNLFGFFGRDQYHDSTPPAYDYDFLAVELGDAPDDTPDPTTSWPFHYAFGTGEGRDDDQDFARNVAGDWSLEANALRLATDLDEPHNSLNTTRVLNFDPGNDFALRANMSLNEMGAGADEARVGLVLLGDEEDFDAEDDETFYTFQWMPDPGGNPGIAVRQGMDGEVIAETSFDTVDDSPVTTVGETYRFDVRGSFAEAGNLEFVAALTDGADRTASVTGTIEEPLEGKNRFGFGARHEAADGAVWGLHDIAMVESWIVDYDPLQAPFTLDFGTSEGQVGLDPLLVAERVQDWSDQDDAIRFASVAGSDDDPGLSWTNSAAVAVVENYQPQQDFSLTTEVTVGEIGRDWNDGWQRFGFSVLGGPHSIEDPFSRNFVGYKLLMMRGQLRINDHGNGIITRENWDGVYENDAVFVLEVEGTYDDNGHLELSFTVTDHTGRSQTLTTDPIEDPYHGNAFGFFGRDRYESGAPPEYDFAHLAMTVDDVVPDGMTFAAWQEDAFTEDQRQDPDISGPGASPARDGVANLLKYAFGLDPFTPAGLSDYIEEEIVEGKLRLTYYERTDAEDIDYVPEVSTDLAGWDSGPEHVEEVNVEPVENSEFNRVTVEAILDDDPDAAFLRVTVEGN